MRDAPSLPPPAGVSAELRIGDKGGAVRIASRYGNAVTAIPGLAASLAPRPVSRRRTATDRSGRRLLYGVVVLRRKSPAHAVSANKKPSDLEGFCAKRLKGLEPSTFCMAIVDPTVDLR